MHSWLHAALPVRHHPLKVLQRLLHGGRPQVRILLYDQGLATYDKGDTFNRDAAKGFIEIQTLSTKTWAVNRRQEGAPAELFDAQNERAPQARPL